MKDNKKKIFIEALEQRIMLDGAGASIALDVIDERNKEQLLNKNQKISKLSENKIEDSSQKLPFDQMARDQKRNDRKQVVFIDSQVQDYQTLIDAFNKDTEVYLIQSNEDGFKKIDKVLKNDADISALHIIGHGSAGQILFGNATLSNDTIKSYNQTLRSIGQSLTEDGDILFYGCNVTNTEGGKTLISKISEITRADIAASDDVTGKGGDWDLEKKIGIVETENVTVLEYDYNLGTFVTASATSSAASVSVNADGITSIAGAVAAYTGSDATSFDFRSDIETGGSVAPEDRWMVVREKTGITSGTITGLLAPRTNGSGTVLSASDRTATASTPFDVYSIHLNRDWNNKSYRIDRVGKITFERNIIGILKDVDETVDDTSATGIALHNTGATYPSSPHDDRNFEDFEIRTFNSSGYTDNDHDFVAVKSDLKTIHVGGKNGSKGDYIRVIVTGAAANTAPTANANTATVNEDDTVTVTGDTATNVTYEVNDEADSATNVTTDTSESEGSGVSFSSDGRKMFITGHQTNRIHEFTLGTPFDPTTKSYVDSVLLDWNNSDNSSGSDYSDDQGDWVRGHTWKPDGTKLFIMNWDGGLSGDASASYRILSYDLTTPYDVSTISRSNDYVNTPTSSDSYDTGLGNVRDLKISSDGTKFYTINKATGKLMQYTFATAYDLSSSVTVGGPYTLTSVTTPRSIAFSDNGKKLFVGDDTTPLEIIHQFNLTTAWDASTLVREGSITPDQTAANDYTDDPFGIAFSNDGTKMFVHDIDGQDEIKVHSLKSPFNLIDIDGENDGDVLADDTDADGDSMTVTAIKVGTGLGASTSVSGGSSYNSSGTSVTGTYGTLRIGADGTYDYAADQDAADALDPGDIVTETFTYTVSDGTDESTATLTITVIGINDAPVADDESDSVAVENTETVTDGVLDVLYGDTDADDSSSLSVFSITATTAGGSETAVNIGTAYNSGYTSVSGSLGTLRIGSDGTYQYIANTTTGTEVFTYKVSDGSTTDEGTLTITVTNTAPVAQDDTGVVNEDDTLVVADGTNLTSVDSATVDGSPLNVAAQVPAMRGITFNTDGTKMFLVGESSDAVSEYHLTTAFDVSTASFDSSFSVSGQEGKPMSVKFNNDGTKMFITGTVSDKIHEYTLSTAFDVSTASFVDSLNVNDKDTSPFGIDFNNDGTKLYFTGDAGNAIHEYDLSTGFDLSTASFNQELNVYAQDREPFGIEFSPDGTRMFIVGTRDNGIDEYVLSTGFDISTATHVCFLSTRYHDDSGNPSGIAFSEDGLKMFIVGNNDDTGSNNDRVDEYTLVSPFSLCNAAGNFTGDLVDSTNASSRDTDADGQTVTVTSVRTGSSEGNGTGGDVASGSSYNSNGTSVTGTYGTLTVGADGSYSYAADQDAADALDVGDMVTESFNYTVSDGSGGTDIAVLTITINGINDVPVADDETNSVNVSTTLNVPDGTDDVLHGDTDADASSSLTVTGIRTGTEIAGSGTDGTVGSGLAGSYGTLTIAADGTYTYVANASGGTDYFTYTVSDGIGGTDTAQITITVNAAPVAADNTGIVNEDGTLTVADGASANSITTAAITYDASEFFDMSAVSSENFTAGLAFNNDGTRMFHGGNDGDAIKEYHLSTAYDVSTASYQGDAQKLDVSGQTTEAFGLTFNNDGTKLYVTGGLGAGKVFQYTLGTAYDVSTQTGSVVEFAAGDTRPCGIRFNNDGTKLFVSGFTGNNIEEIHLSTAYDLSTASRSDSDRLSVNAQAQKPRDIEFNIDGTRMFVVSGEDKDISEYKLSTAYDVSTGVYVGDYNIRLNPNDGLDLETEPFSLLFNKMGTKMFMMGYTTDDVHEYELTSPYNLINVKDEHDGDVLGDDTDVNSDTLTVTLVRTGSSEGSGTEVAAGSVSTGTYGQLTLDSDGSYTYVANQSAADALDSGDVVTDSFNYTVSDGSLTDIAVLEITVIGINDNPTAVADTDVVVGGNTVTDSTNSAGTLVSDDTDPDASASLFITQVTPSGGSATPITHNSTKVSNAATISGAKGTLTIGSDGSYSYAANSDATSGNDVFTYTLSDGASTTTATLTITVTAANNAPTASNSTVYISENNQVSSAGDRTPSNITKIFAASDFNFSDSDGDSLSKIKITTLESAGALEYYNGSSWTDVTLNQEITASDIGNNYLRFTPAANSESDVTFAFKVHDGTEYSSSAYTMTISVNAAPNVSDATVSVAAGANATGDVHDDVADSDDADSVLVVTGVASGNESSNNTIVTDGTGVGSSISGTYGSLNIAANGTYTYTANATNNIAADSTANDIFTFTTRDDETNAGSFAFDVGTITFTVASSISLVADTDAVVEDGTVTHLTNSAGTVISDDAADTDGLVVTNISHTNGNSDTIESGSTYTDSGGEPGIVVGTYGTLTIGADGTYTYTADQSAADALDAGDVVTDVFTYTADGATATLTITVTGRNDEPAAVNDTDAVNEGATETVTSGSDLLMADDTDADASSSLTVTQIAVTGGSDSAVSSGSSYNSSGTSIVGTYGTLIVGADGTYSYAADQTAANALDAGDSVTDSFTYTISDGTNTDTATLIITVTGVNDTPTAGNETVYINENNTDATHGERTSLNIRKDFAASDFTNYTDPDDDVGIKIKSLPSSGTLTKINNGATLSVNDTVTNISNLRYTPDANSESDDSFTYKAYDGTVVGDNERTITISVNAAPVAVNDTGSITAGDDDATGNVLTNDTDSDDASSALAVRGVGAGAEGSTLANSNVGSAVSGTYGDLTISSAGTYTYSVTGNAATIALRAGETATDVFSYKVRDDETNAGSKAIDIGTITFTVTGIDGDAIGEPDPDEPPKLKEKKKDKKQKREERKELKRLKREKRLERKELKIPKSNLEKNAEFNQGLKLVDLVAESKSLELKDKDKDIYLDKIVAKYSDKNLKVKFKVFDDEGKEVQKYYGEMKDGSPLPDWIKVDPKTGKTKTDIPKGVKMVEFKIVAVDAENNKKQVTVVIDAKKIAQDKEILKQSRKIERAKKLEVKNDGSVKLNSVNEAGKIDKTKTEVLNEIDSVEELVKTIEPDEFLNFEAEIENENFEVELPWQNLKVVLNNGQELPEWIKYDPKTGKVTATPPENVKSVDLKVIVENPNGELSVKDIKLDFVDKNAQETKNITDNETKFVSLSSQLSKEYSDWDNYGSQLIDRL